MPNTISDGFGNEWEKCELGDQCGLQVVRPGKVQCWCDHLEEITEARAFVWDLLEENKQLRKELGKE